jgi:hypothetical protein
MVIWQGLCPERGNLCYIVAVHFWPVLISFLVVFTSLTYAQEEDRQSLPTVVKRDSTYLGETTIGKKKNVQFTPFLAPSFAPETQLMVNVGGLLSFRIDPHNEKVQRSSLPFSAGYSTNKSLLVNLRPAVFFKGDRNRLAGDLWIKIMPDNYWGVGYENARKPEKPDSTTRYQRHWYQALLKFSHHFGKNVYGGLLVDINKTSASDMSATIATDPNIIKDGPDITNVSVGLLFQYDTRDVTINAYEGMLVEISSNFYGRYLGGTNDYQVIVFDYRQYQRIQRDGRTLAWQIKSRMGLHDVPWPEMSFLGTPFDLRGYRWGQYRDKTILFGIAEYRHMFMRQRPRKDGNMMSRFGFVTWLATGSLAPSPGSLQHWLPNGGVGLRFEVQKRMNARVDFGIGARSNAFYVSFNEAF